MKTYNFLEWVLIKEDQQVEASVVGKFDRLERGKEERGQTSDPKVGDLIISNAQEFMDNLITRKTGKIKNDGKIKVNSRALSKGSISAITRNGQYVIRDITVNRGKPTPVPRNLLLDVSAAFNDDFSSFDLKGPRQAVFLFNRDRQPNKSSKELKHGKSHERVERRWKRWLAQIAPHQIQDLELLRGRTWLAGDDPSEKHPERTMGQQTAAEFSSKRGTEAKIDQIQQMNWAAEAGMDLTDHPEIRTSVTGDEHWVRLARNIGADALIDQFHDKGYEVAGEKYRRVPQKEPADLGKIFGQPERDPIAKTIDQGRGVVPLTPEPKDLDDLIRRNQMRHRTYQPEVPDDDIEVAWYNPWKTNNDKRFYRYYAEV